MDKNCNVAYRVSHHHCNRVMTHSLGTAGQCNKGKVFVKGHFDVSHSTASAEGENSEAGVGVRLNAF